MGLLDMFYSAGGRLDPVSPPVGVYHRLAREEPTTLILREKILSFSGDDFAITDGKTGKTVLKCKGKMFSLHDRKKVTDADGNLLFNVAEKTRPIGQAFVAEDKAGQEVMRVRKKFSLGSKLVATFLDAGRETIAEVHGDFWGGSANISLKDGTRLAHIGRDMLNTSEVMADQQTYHVTIAPGVDISLIATLCILFDEAKNEEDDAGMLHMANSVRHVL